MFQATALEKDQVLGLVKTINRASPDKALDENRLVRAFDGLWNQLANDINNIRKKEPEVEQIGREAENPVLEEILVLVRQQAQMVASAQANPPVTREIKQYFEEFRYDLFDEFRKDILTAVVRMSSSPNIDLSAWRELSEYWTALDAAWDRIEASVKLPDAIGGIPGMIQTPEEAFMGLFDSIVRLRKPIRFVLDRWQRTEGW